MNDLAEHIFRLRLASIYKNEIEEHFVNPKHDQTKTTRPKDQLIAIIKNHLLQSDIHLNTQTETFFLPALTLAWEKQNDLDKQKLAERASELLAAEEKIRKANEEANRHAKLIADKADELLESEGGRLTVNFLENKSIERDLTTLNLFHDLLESKFNLGIDKRNFFAFLEVVVERIMYHSIHNMLSQHGIDSYDACIAQYCEYAFESIHESSTRETFIQVLHEKGFMYDQTNISADIDKGFKSIALINLENKITGVAHFNETKIDSMTGVEFENFLETIFQNHGYSVTKTPCTGDYGADLIINKLGITTCVQAKRYTSKVDLSAIQEVCASLKFYNAQSGIVVTTSYFTTSAKELAYKNNIRLIDRDELLSITGSSLNDRH